MTPDRELPLRAWLHVFAPPYRGLLTGMIVLNALSAAATFAELQVLRSLTVVLSRSSAPAPGCGFGSWAMAGFPIDPSPCGPDLPLYLLATYTLVILLQSCVDFAAFACNSRLTQRARRDVERELLRNLLRQDDAFYLRRAPSEIISRLGGDLMRVGGRRQIATQAIAIGLSLVAVAWVLFAQSPIAALVGVAISVLGVLAAAPLLTRQRALDRRMIAADEAVKAGFEDSLQGVAEVQVSGLLRTVLHRFGQRQAVRDRAALVNADLNSGMIVLQKLTFTIGFIAALALFVLADLFHNAGPEGSATAGLIVLLIATLPQLYYKFGELTHLFTQYQISDVSASRLLQYEAPPQPPQPRAMTPDGTILLRGVRYRFAGSPVERGGPAGISLTLRGQGLVGIVGPAGAGKSTLLRLILGRQRPLAGEILMPSEQGGFVYLPQRPILFDATIRENLFPADPDTRAAALLSAGDQLETLGLLDLIRTKGLDSPPQPSAVDFDLAGLRARFRAAAELALAIPLHPLGVGRAGLCRMVVESLLGCVVDQEGLSERLTSAHSREAVRALAELPIAPALAMIAVALVRRTTPLLSQTVSADDYNRIAAVRIEQGTWQLRRGALDVIQNLPPDGPPPDRPVHPILVAVAVSARVEELEGATLPVAEGTAERTLRAMVAGIASPLDPATLNTMLTWRENLLFATADGAAHRQQEQLDQLVLENLRRSSADTTVLEAGLDTPVARLGGQLSGGQQQLVALGRALLSPARFLILDEPSSAFHPQLRTALIAVLQREARARSVVMVTHDMDLARSCDRIIFVREGAVAGDGTWETLEQDNLAFRDWTETNVRAA